MNFLSKENPKKFDGKTVLIRVDFNIAQPTDTFRLEAILPTLQYFKKSNAKIVLISHRGKPKAGHIDENQSLRIVLPYLNRALKKKFIFIPEIEFPAIEERIKTASPGSVLLLENIRFFKGEIENSPALGKQLARLGDYYINDAFAASHRENASITQIPRFLPSYLGIRFEKELSELAQALDPKKRLAFVLGGAKVKDKIAVIRRFETRVYAFLTGGMVANTFLKANGVDIKASPYSKEEIPTAQKLLRNKKVILPFDFIEHENKFLDLGPLSIQQFIEILKPAQTIVWAGPLGVFEKPEFRESSTMLAKALAKSNAFIFIGGGETAELIRLLKLEKKMSFISTGGGAMLEYLAGKTLPGLDALKK